MAINDVKDKVKVNFGDFFGLRGAIRGLILSTVIYALTPEGAATLANLGVAPQYLALLAFVGAAIKNRKKSES